VKVHGIHPPEGHDIPGVRSIGQLKMTDHYKPDGYDELVEVTNQEAFDMCKRLNQEESLIAGPSSGMQVVGALRLMADEPGNIGVIIFCDDIFKYTTSVTKHCPDVFPKPNGPQFANAELNALASVLEAAKDGADSLNLDALQELKPVIEDGGANVPLIIDVRPQDQFSSKLRALKAVNITMATLLGQEDGESEVVQVFDLPGAVQKKKAPEVKNAKRPLESVNDAFKAALGTVPALDTNILLV